MKKIHKLAIYLNGSEYIEGDFKLKIYDYIIDKDTVKTITLLDNKRSIRHNKTDINLIQTDYRNDSFASIYYYTFCYTKDIEKMTKQLVDQVKIQFINNELLYTTAKIALGNGLRIIQVI